MRRTTQLRQTLGGAGTGILVEAHNGLTAKLVEEAGFPAIWGSGLALSASMGVRDNNELSRLIRDIRGSTFSKGK